MNIVRVRRCAVYLGVAMVENLFSRTDAVAVRIQEGRICIFPILNPDAGGLTLKVVNATGDRMVVAQDAFREHGLEDVSLSELCVEWRSDVGALVSAPLQSANKLVNKRKNLTLFGDTSL